MGACNGGYVNDRFLDMRRAESGATVRNLRAMSAFDPKRTLPTSDVLRKFSGCSVSDAYGASECTVENIGPTG